MPFAQAVAGRLCYLSGPIAGLDPEKCAARFAEADAICRRNGAAGTFNPMDPKRQMARAGWTRAQHMLADVHALTTSHKGDGTPSYTLVRLPGWSRSDGAQLEADVAIACGMEVYDLPVTEWEGADHGE
ncbi:MAG TPA: hypothetical protein DCP91_08590 [Eggerthellaceae bacterium]|nr:hypothetical protein [Eggerthellaceae bacterium]